MRILAVRHSNENRVFMDRLYWPMAQAEKYGDHVTWATSPKHAESLLSGMDILVHTRVADQESLELMHKANAMGVRIVVDIDDAVHAISNRNPYYVIWGSNRDILRQWIEIYREIGEPKMRWCYVDYDEDTVFKLAAGRRRAVEQALRLAHLVTTSTPSLAKFYKDLLKLHDVVVLPNQISEHEWKGVKKQNRRDGHVLIRWGGSDTHHDDLACIQKPIQEAMEACPYLDFEVMGLGNYGARMFDNLPQDRFASHFSIPHGDYMWWLAHADIIVAPSDGSLFAKCKSDIRVLQAGWMGIPVVVSPATYGHTVLESKMGLVAQTGKQWVDHLVKLANDEVLRKELGAHGHEYVTGLRTYETNYPRWQAAYRELQKKSHFLVSDGLPGRPVARRKRDALQGYRLRR